MIIRLDHLDDPYDWQETVDLAADDLGNPEVLELEPVRCRGRISPTSSDGVVEDDERSSYLLRARLRYRQTLRCVRCLEPVADDVESDFTLLLIAAPPSAPTVEEHQLEEADLGVMHLDSPELDTRPIVVEQVDLGIPLRSLCRDDCAGLCAECGADLNAGACSCEKPIDPRWGALAAVRKTVSESEESP